MRKKSPKIIKNFEVVKYVFKFCPGFIYFAILHIIASVVKSVSRVLLITNAINAVIQNQDVSTVYDLLKSILLFIIIIIVCSIINVVYDNYISPRYQLIYQKNVQSYIYSKVKIIDMELYDDPEFYDRFTRGCRESSWRGFRTFTSSIAFIINVLSAIALGAYIVLSDPLLIVIVLTSSIVTLVTINIVRKLWYKIFKLTENERRYQMYVNRTFYNQKNGAELKTTNIDELLKLKYIENTDSMNKKYINHHWKLLAPESIGMVFRILVCQAGTYIILLYRLFKQVINVAEFTSTANAVLQFASNFEAAIDLFAQLKENLLYVEDLIWVLNYKPVVEEEKERIEDLKFKKLVIDNITFKYPKNDKYAIKNLSMEITKGQKIAIVGDNGSGKTTLMKLLLSFYKPTEGNIILNDVNYNEISTTQIREKYSIVFQDFQIYAVTIAENVLMRRVETKEDEELVWEALRKVGLEQKIKKFKNNIYTLVTREFDRDGISFSGGERQRLAIARVFASNKDIYILDEPTSALDPLAEERINKLIIDSAGDKTMLIIAHRLSTVVDADIIYLVREGNILEKGTHKQLMELNGRYAYMFNVQKELYEVKK